MTGPIEERIKSLKRIKKWKLQWRAQALEYNNKERADRYSKEIKELDKNIKALETRAAARGGYRTL